MCAFSILVLNAVGMSLHFELFEKTDADALRSIMHGRISHIGGRAQFVWNNNQVQARVAINVANHREAAEWVLEWLEYLWPLGSLIERLKIVAHHCVNCQGHAPAVLVESRFQHERTVFYKSDAHCIISASREWFPEDIQLITVFHARNGGKTICSRQAALEIAGLALQAIQPACI